MQLKNNNKFIEHAKVFNNYYATSKEEIEKMALLQFPKACFDRSDEADALAIAVCHIHTLKINANLNSAMKKAM